jgi:hypothetical protein
VDWDGVRIPGATVRIGKFYLILLLEGKIWGIVQSVVSVTGSWFESWRESVHVSMISRVINLKYDVISRHSFYWVYF